MGRPKGSKNGERALIERTCERCSQTFYVRPYNAGARYCSTTCYHPQRPAVQCQGCGRLYVPSPSTRGRYCSIECSKKRVQKTCPQCGKPFEVKNSKAAKFNYCSLECKRAARPVKICVHCGKQFTVNSARATSACYCSCECNHLAHRITFHCAYCGQERTVKKYRVTSEGQRCCSNRCATLLRAEQGWLPHVIAEKRRTGRRTDIEKITESVLLHLDLPYLFEHKVGRYSVDFALPTLGVALECDGWQHQTAEGKERDAKRDAALSQDGWLVLHLNGEQLRKDALNIIQNALAAISESSRVVQHT